LDFKEQALELHRRNKGKLAIASKVPLRNRQDLTLAYTPGVAEPCKEIAQDKNLVYDYTNRGNTVAIVTDGSAVLGLGNIGPEAALPVMEGKAVLFKSFADVDAVPVCLASQDTDEIVQAVRLLAPGYGGINLEDIAAPRCFQIERQLQDALDIPVFHDDQHGTAIVVLAALLNALRLTGREIKNSRVVINGAGSAGIAIAKLLVGAGVADLILCDRHGTVHSGAAGNNPAQEEMAAITNPRQVKGGLADALRGADVFIGVSAGGVLNAQLVSLMSRQAIVFAMANPVPEIWPDEAKAGGAAVIGTGRSDFPNQINNVLAFPGVFRGALDVRAAVINEEMKLAAADAIASIAVEQGLSADYIIPDVFDCRVVEQVAAAVGAAARSTGVART
jgi:malate dehydrogenase (oxaloacetate-decarboxylating)